MEPLIEPSNGLLTILQDHGPEQGGWGPAAIDIFQDGSDLGPIRSGPVVSSRTDTETIWMLTKVAQLLAERTGKKTILARFSPREDLIVIDPNSVGV